MFRKHPNLTQLTPNNLHITVHLIKHLTEKKFPGNLALELFKTAYMRLYDLKTHGTHANPPIAVPVADIAS